MFLKSVFPGVCNSDLDSPVFKQHGGHINAFAVELAVELGWSEYLDFLCIFVGGSVLLSPTLSLVRFAYHVSNSYIHNVTYAQNHCHMENPGDFKLNITNNQYKSLLVNKTGISGNYSEDPCAQRVLLSGHFQGTQIHTAIQKNLIR